MQINYNTVYQMWNVIKIFKLWLIQGRTKIINKYLILYCWSTRYCVDEEADMTISFEDCKIV